MKLSLKRLYGRSMTGGLDLAEAPTPPSPRSAARKTALVSLALVLAIVGALVGGYYFAMRPVFLKVAVGPWGDEGPWGSRGFSVPPGLETVEVDPFTGFRGGWGCPGEPELFLAGTAPEESCLGFRLDPRSFRGLVEMGGEEAFRLIRRLLRRER